MTQTKVDLFRDSVEKVAASVSRSFPDIEREDLTQELYLFLLGESRLKTPDQVGATNALFRKAKMVAWEIRKRHLHLTAQYSYRIDDIRAILETVFQYEDWQHASIPEGAYSEYGDLFLVVSADVKRAWEKLPKTHQKAIFERYATGTLVMDGRGRQAISRATLALQEELNYRTLTRNGDFVGTRRVINNATARARIDNTYEEQ